MLFKLTLQDTKTKGPSKKDSPKIVISRCVEKPAEINLFKRDFLAFWSSIDYCTELIVVRLA